MSKFAAFLVPASATGGRDGVITTALVAAGSTGDIVIGFRRVFAIIADSAIHVRWGLAATIANAAATDFLIPANMMVTLEMGEEFDRIRVFAATGATGNVYVLPLTV